MEISKMVNLDQEEKKFLALLEQYEAINNPTVSYLFTFIPRYGAISANWAGFKLKEFRNFKHPEQKFKGTYDGALEAFLFYAKKLVKKGWAVEMNDDIPDFTAYVFPQNLDLNQKNFLRRGDIVKRTQNLIDSTEVYQPQHFNRFSKHTSSDSRVIAIEKKIISLKAGNASEKHAREIRRLEGQVLPQLKFDIFASDWEALLTLFENKRVMGF